MEDARGISFITLMIIIAVVSLILRIAVEQIIKVTVAQNESGASATLKLISTALENYAKDNQGAFPSNFSVLTQNNPSYLDKDYLAESPFKGYNYSCLRLEASGYSCSANPTSCKLTGTMVYTITTGGLLVWEKCESNE